MKITVAEIVRWCVAAIAMVLLYAFTCDLWKVLFGDSSGYPFDGATFMYTNRTTYSIVSAMNILALLFVVLSALIFRRWFVKALLVFAAYVVVNVLFLNPPWAFY